MLSMYQHNSKNVPEYGSSDASPLMPEPAWHLYIVRCADGSLYTGIARDVERRLAEHRAGTPRGARYLRGRGPLALALAAPVGSRGSALRVERAVKALPKRRKEALVAGAEPVADLLARLTDRRDRRARPVAQRPRAARQRAKSSRVSGSVGG